MTHRELSEIMRKVAKINREMHDNNAGLATDWSFMAAAFGYAKSDKQGVADCIRYFKAIYGKELK